MHDPHRDPLDDKFAHYMNRASGFGGLSVLIVMVAGPTAMYLLTGLAPHGIVGHAVVYLAAAALIVCALIGLVLSGIRSVDAMRKAQELN